MPKLLIGLGLVVVILTVYTLVDCALADRNRIRGLPRWVWIFVLILVPVIGPLLWLFVGRGRAGGAGGRITRSLAPDDDPDFLQRLGRESRQQERIRQMEQELADLDKPDPRADSAPRPDAAPGRDPKPADPGEGEQPDRRDV
ncbi:PLD nuclease N-terminal domain-containing protein [Cryobacterium tagatosivorans]|uniref:PLDc_N domain-containing protein n=1 Tax=Cryobacterium tagatosivorans TaxID=1259199 RepID=A0A4R8UEP5_9MICO|nr:PLD nuclease N-terminal domain-containing protein [Cryobacterium tagatosivorans]TFB50277.1 PLDc_N domain-containing protein [Cryobacterium tagatosivorans]